MAKESTHSKGEEKKKKESTLLILKSDSFLKTIQALTNSFGTSGSGMIFNMGLNCGYSEGTHVLEESKEPQPDNSESLLEKSFYRSTSMGWGDISIDHYDAETSTLEITIDNNPFKDNCGTERLEGCHFIRGYLAGVVSEILDTDMVFTSDECKGTQDGYCTFHMEKASDRSARKIEELLKSSENKPDNR
jgi:predicted hydrocarbon binding protein